MDSIYFSEIGRNDVVILGGGGLLDFQTRFNATIQKLCESCDTVIFWGGGHNGEYDEKNKRPTHLEPNIDINRFALCGVRDYGLDGYEYTPCASSANPLLKFAQEKNPTKKICTMFHNKGYTDALQNNFENKSHYHNIEDVINFIANHEIVITESYHCALWATLANRKVIMPKEILKSVKYNYLRYKPTFLPFKEILEIQETDNLSDLPNYPLAYEESFSEVYSFMKKVKEVVTSKIPTPQLGYIDFYERHRLGEIIQRCDVLLDANSKLRAELSAAELKIKELEAGKIQ
ncbi:hypothetical protein [Aquicoccus sp. SU-CL01552]|uniref:polysaccharide pyruvyl transferase family protein n=1 Tax=Aquicoccus sp. SU-CL01552 TaxID=3127656 RepID=UPI003342167F